MINDLELYSISDRYISFLQEREPDVYSNKENRRRHTRKYAGVVLKIEDFCYYIPLSSPKESDSEFAGFFDCI